MHYEHLKPWCIKQPLIQAKPNKPGRAKRLTSHPVHRAIIPDPISSHPRPNLQYITDELPPVYEITILTTSLDHLSR